MHMGNVSNQLTGSSSRTLLPPAAAQQLPGAYKGRLCALGRTTSSQDLQSNIGPCRRTHSVTGYSPETQSLQTTAPRRVARSIHKQHQHTNTNSSTHTQTAAPAHTNSTSTHKQHHHTHTNSTVQLTHTNSTSTRTQTAAAHSAHRQRPG